MDGKYSYSQNITINSRQTQKQKPAAAVVQGVKLLSLPYISIDRYLAETALENPFLDFNNQWEAPAADFRHGQPEVTEISRSFDRREKFRRNDDEEADGLWNRSGIQFEPDTLSGSLEFQLSLCRLTSVERALGREILGNLDERGYFTGNLDSICRYYRAEPEAGRKVLSLIQGFTPRGIAARDIYECLCLQIEDSEPLADVTRRIIRDDLENLSKNRIAQCAQKYRLPEDMIRRVFARIRSLNPRPGNQSAQPNLCCSNVCYTVPDIIIKKEGGGFHIYIQGEAGSPLLWNEDYVSMLTHGCLSRGDEDYLRARFSEAKLLMKGICIRQQTLRRFAMALVKKQYDFFAKGQFYLYPMTMQNLADEIGVHVTTVCRAVQNKYIDTPWGLYSLKHFFSSGCDCAKNDAVEKISVHQIKSRIQALINGEDSANPVTDAQICLLLQQEGYQISRRTVTKYRQALGLASQIKRKIV